MEEYNFSVQLYFSKEDEGWWALTPEFPGISCFGESRAEALKEIESLFPDLCDIEGDETPEPIVLDGYDREYPLQPSWRR